MPSQYPATLDEFDADHSNQGSTLAGPDLDAARDAINRMQEEMGAGTLAQTVKATLALKQDASGAASDVELAAAISAEVTARTNAINAAITGEASTRAAADAALTTALATESSTRATADTTNATAITSEATARASAVTAEASARTAADALLAPLDSPAFTGNPTVPTQSPGNNTTRAASTAFAAAAVAVEAGVRQSADTALDGRLTTAESGKAPINDPVFTGDPRVPTPSGFDNDTSIANTQWVSQRLAGTASSAELGAEQSARIAADALAARALSPTAVKTGAYTAAANEYVPIDTTLGAVPVTLPSASADQSRIGVKHVIQGGTNAVTIASGGSDVFNKAGGATSFTLPLLAQAVLLQYKASTGIWYVQADDVPLSQLDLRYAGRGMLYGDGSDGDVTVTGTVTLTRDMQYGNLIVNGTLNTGCFRVHVRGALTGAGTITWTGSAGPGTGGVPTTAGGFYHPATASTGGDGGTGAGAATDPGFARQTGGTGGAGGTGSGGVGGAPTTNGILVNHSGVSRADIAKIHPLQLHTGRGMGDGTTAGAYVGGSGGCGGGGDGTKAASGGQGGGIVAVWCYNAAAFTGTISANGAAGGSPPAGNRGGGGGGGGGLAALFSAALPTGAYTIQANGGAGGTGSGTGTSGANGSAGTTIAAVV